MSSFVRINLRPDLLYPVPLLPRRLSVLARALESLCAQAHVDFVLRFRAVSSDLPEETAGMALIEGGDDIGAVCGSVSVKPEGTWRGS